MNGFGSHLWPDKVASVRKGQKAAYVAFYKEIEVDDVSDYEND